MSGASESVDAPHSNDLEDLNFGFRRSEMYENSLAGTLQPPYNRHVFLCYGSPEAWPSRVEDSEADLLPNLLASAFKVRKNDISVKTRLTVCEGGDGANFSEGDLLIFPEMIKYRSLKNSDVDIFVEEVLVQGKPWRSGVQDVLTGSHVFVCAHGNRDQRCGLCGPALIEKFKTEIEVRGLKDQVFISACSHIGGHKYAGNLIIFSPDKDGKITGHWYGYVCPSDVAVLLDQHIGKGEIIERLWRGQMGAPPGEGGGEGAGKGRMASKKHKIAIKESSFEGRLCCHGGSESPCCSNGRPHKGVGSVLGWLGAWGQGDVWAALGVIGAMAAVAVAYGVYRKSS